MEATVYGWHLPHTPYTPTHSGHKMDADLKPIYPFISQFQYFSLKCCSGRKLKSEILVFYLFKEKQDLATFSLSQSIYLNLQTGSAYRQIKTFPTLRVIDIARPGNACNPRYLWEWGRRIKNWRSSWAEGWIQGQTGQCSETLIKNKQSLKESMGLWRSEAQCTWRMWGAMSNRYSKSKVGIVANTIFINGPWDTVLSHHGFCEWLIHLVLKSGREKDCVRV